MKYSSIADTGAADNIIDSETANELGLLISTDPNPIREFSLCGKRVVRSIGKTTAEVTFIKGAPVPSQCSFCVLEKCAVPVIMGKKFLDTTNTLTKHKYRLQKCRTSSECFPRILEIGSTGERLRCMLDRKEVLMNLDSGSEINVMSLAYAMKHGYWDQRSTHHGRVVLGDGSKAETLGEVTASLVLGYGYGKEYQEVFHILPGLNSDVLLGEGILQESNTFPQFAPYFVYTDSTLDIFDLNILRWRGLLEIKLRKSFKALVGRNQEQYKLVVLV